MRSGAKVGIVGGVFALVLGGVGYGAYNILDGLGDSGVGGGTSTAADSSEVKTGPVTEEEIADTSKEFLAAWAEGDAAVAAALTNNKGDAEPALAGYSETAHVTKAVITPGTATGSTVPYTVKATVSYKGTSKPWSYASKLTVVRGLTTGRPLVDWEPAVIHPDLAKGESLETGESSTASIEAVDRNGQVLTKEKYPSLGGILDELRKKYGEKAGGTTGIETWINSASADGADRTLLTLVKGKPGKLQTTLDAKIQAAAERGVKKFAQASVAAVEPSTGAIRAIANNRDDAFDAARQGKVAPGSTMKIITAAMIIQNGLGSANTAVQCPATVPWMGVTFHNLDDFSMPSATLKTAFARSCNTAFIKPVLPLKEKRDTALGVEAHQYFGLGGDNWQTGIATWDGGVPESQDAETAASFIGQGKIQMNPLNMASVTATAVNGRFRQPFIVAQSLDNRTFATATPLPPGVSSQLKDMLRYTATAPEGTATQAMASVRGDKGAKTGSAEVDGHATSDSWFTGFNNDLAAAALVQSGGHGGDAAGPVVAEVLRAGP
ncbi:MULTISPECIES: penicillin-binding transpeptidase domain-containing protein [unclassified Streptomyces]|uniref:penicillin-binding transpeptidase domain-containing protein n=1 Tax=unclassified Streptomyces TaxID=2593676 RepID=UPI002ED41B31|nr:penicillin-binding transpeptidase domain-containing protein [Streptomyces sp. NBC_00891]WSY05913.1 penicillin-binding transpeptidase domain-containing protein [Streptomyces sp. NBC_00890]WSZ07537.1 penicillin-binding transpeptidase domain-containing protein [Streptomyces sp. NBC_00869]WSZ24964.1 penicillin-binding transpeptidase domain-containing protein [Streptomyces sp. NBC_00870]